tara:strand:- start:301 stop:1125 length:825 start_codon:yes stop_codon:yes gene_type:complete
MMIEQTEILGGVSPLKKRRGGRRQSSRGGRSAGQATATSSRRGGFAKSKGARGAGGGNVGGYNVRTRFSADKWQKPPSGGYFPSTSKGGSPSAGKPYTTDGKGNIVINNNIYNKAVANANVNSGPSSKTTTTPDEYGTRVIPAVYGERDVTKTKDFSKEWQGPKSKEYPDGMPYDIWIKQPGSKQQEKDFIKSQQYKVKEKFEISPQRTETYLKKKGGTTKETNGGGGSASATAEAISQVNNQTDSDKDDSVVKFKMKGNPMYRNFGIGGKPKK